MDEKKITDEYAIELLKRAKRTFFDFDKVQLALDRAIELLEKQVKASKKDRHSSSDGVG